jgi:hypothetical protein
VKIAYNTGKHVTVSSQKAGRPHLPRVPEQADVDFKGHLQRRGQSKQRRPPGAARDHEERGPQEPAGPGDHGEEALRVEERVASDVELALQRRRRLEVPVLVNGGRRYGMSGMGGSRRFSIGEGWGVFSWGAVSTDRSSTTMG